MKPAYTVGTTYRNRKGQLCTVADILTTTNSQGDVVSIRYVSFHLFLGQTVMDHDVLPITIAKGLVP